MDIALADAELVRLLEEDAPYGDLTTATLAIGIRPGRLEFRARREMTVCALEEAARLLTLAGARSETLRASGGRVVAGTPLLRATGSAAALHRAWKCAQVLVEWASGISTAAAAIVTAADGVPVACTRKNVPGCKQLSVKAVRAGGAIMHRLGLSESLLLFAEHRDFLAAAPAQTIAELRQRQPERKIAVEVATGAEARCWAEAGADVLQLEKFTPAELAACRAALDRSGRRPVLAATGGIDAGNAADYAAAGADLLVTSAPYWAPPKDIQVELAAAP